MGALGICRLDFISFGISAAEVLNDNKGRVFEHVVLQNKHMFLTWAWQ